MTDFHSLLIVVGLDERDESLISATKSMTAAMAISRVTVLHVRKEWELPPYWMGPPPDFDLRRNHEADRRRLSNLTTLLRETFPEGVQYESRLEEGSLVPLIASTAADVSADLCSIGRFVNEESYWTDHIPAIVRKTPCSVFVVPENVAGPFARLLVPVDFSNASREAFELAVQVARQQSNAFIEAIHICDVPFGFSKAGPTYESFGDILKDRANEQAMAWMAEMKPEGVTVNWRFDVRDSAASAIVAAAERDDMDLILMGGHGRTLPAAALLGHTADTVCSRTRRPFLCVKQKGQVVHLLQAMAEVLEVG